MRVPAAFVVCSLALSGARGAEVSFANEIAPILADQCLVCHNARTAKGRFSVETFAALMKGGESGAAVTPGDAELSNLALLVESGEMPKDGDPLPSEQIALIKQWIADGAKLDEGKPADKPLAAIMPKPVQPKPPEVYPAPVPVTALAFSPSGLLAVSGYHEVLVFDAGEGRLMRRIQGLAERVHAIAFSPDGQHVAAAAGTPGRLGEVKLFRTETGELVADLAFAGDSFFDVAFSPDGTKLAAAGADRTVRVWNVPDGVEVARIEDHADWVLAVAFSPDGGRIATASRDKTAKVFDVSTKESLATFMRHEQPVTDVLFAPDGKQVVSCGKDRQVRFWDVAEAKQQHDRDLRGEGLSLAAAGSEALVCGSGDRAARVFGFDGSERGSFRDHPDWVYAVAATPDGATIAIGSYDGTVTLRKTDGGEVTRTFLAMPPTP
jgi:WD40 repeat protein